MRIRLATTDDLNEMSDLGLDFHVNSTFSSMNYSKDDVEKTIRNLIENNQFVVVAESDNKEIIGVMLGLIEKSWFGKDFIASDLTLLVKKNFRGGLVAFRLVKSFIKWAKLAGASQIRPGVSSGNFEADVFYKRLGFLKCGSNFYMTGGE